MEKEYYWKYCIPEEKENYFKAQAHSVINSAESSNNVLKCNWKTLREVEKEHDKNTIAHLLRLMYQFLRVEHAFNMLALYEKTSKLAKGDTNGNKSLKITLERENNLQHSSTSDENDLLKRIKNSCDLKSQNDKKALNDLFLSPDLRKKSCLPSPVVTNIYLKLGEQLEGVVTTQSNSQKSNNTFLSKEKISKGVFSGSLGYSLFDYWTKLKKNSHSNSNLPVIMFSSSNKYLLGEDESSSISEPSSPNRTFNLKKFFGLVESWNLKLENFFSSSENISLKLEEKSSENLIY